MSAPDYHFRKALDDDGFAVFQGWDLTMLGDPATSTYSEYRRFLAEFGRVDTAYPLFYKVTDQGEENYQIDSRDSDTSLSHPLHTDGTAIDQCPRYIVLACIAQADHGGDSELADARRVFKKLTKSHPEVIAHLTAPICRDVKGGSLDQIRANSYPIFTETDGQFIFRYVRKWIDVAQFKLSETNKDLTFALDILDASLQEEKVNLRLIPGDVLVVDNHRMAHGRSTFTDGANKRLLYRTWLYE